MICHFHPGVSRNSDRNYVVMEVRGNLLKDHCRDPLDPVTKSLKFNMEPGYPKKTTNQAIRVLFVDTSHCSSLQVDGRSSEWLTQKNVSCLLFKTMSSERERESHSMSLFFAGFSEIVCWYQHNFTGWWFGTFFIFPYIGNSNPNSQLPFIFFRRVGIPPTSFKTNLLVAAEVFSPMPGWTCWAAESMERFQAPGAPRSRQSSAKLVNWSVASWECFENMESYIYIFYYILL